MWFSFFELSLPDDDPVYTLKKVMEELDFSGLLANCSDKGRTGYNPFMMYAVVTYANMRGIRSVDRIVDFIAVVSFGLTCFGLGYTFSKDNTKPQK